MVEITRTVVLDAQTEALRLRRFSLRANGNEAKSFGSRRVTIGSHPSNDFVLDDSSVSRYHARLEIDRSGYRLLDLDSKNGTRVDGVRIANAWLDDGCRLGFGQSDVEFRLLSDEVEVALSKRTRFGRLRGSSERMREIFALLEKVAPTDATVLVEGESGTGKELVAEAVHEASERRNGPLIVFDCSAVSPELIESELFGHVRGAFTGAVGARAGAFEQARGGTLFIDELGELDLELQPKLLRALEQRQIRRVGSNDTVDIDTRIIAATNRKLRDEVAAGNFREDLYYRFAVITVSLPPLRERREDLPMLVEHFLHEITRTHRLGDLNISFQTMEKLRNYGWPGNVRELRNFIERAALLSAGGEVDARFLPDEGPQREAPPESASCEGWLKQAGVDLDLPFKEAKAELVDRFERLYWERQLALHDNNISAAGRATGVHRKTVEYIVRKLGLRSEGGET